MNSARTILVVDDDQVDQIAVKRALKEINVPNPVGFASNGEEALVFLRERPERPCIILLDLNMPTMNGIEFLRKIKQDAALKMIPVVVLTTSSEQQDKIESFGLGVAGYMLKPNNYAKFVETMRTIDRYWSESELPA